MWAKLKLGVSEDSVKGFAFQESCIPLQTVSNTESPVHGKVLNNLRDIGMFLGKAEGRADGLRPPSSPDALPPVAWDVVQRELFHTHTSDRST